MSDGALAAAGYFYLEPQLVAWALKLAVATIMVMEILFNKYKWCQDGVSSKVPCSYCVGGRPTEGAGLFHDGQDKRSSALSKLGDRKCNILEIDKLSFNEIFWQ